MSRQPWSLRRTLVVQTVTLLAVAAVAVPLAVSGIVERQLDAQVEDQITGVTASVGQALSGRDDVTLDVSSIRGVVGASFVIVGVTEDGEVRAPAGETGTLSQADADALVAATEGLGAGETVEAATSGFPVTATRAPTPGLSLVTDAGETIAMDSLVLAVDTSRDATIVRRLRLVSALVGAAALVVLAAATALTIRRGLAPLDAIAADARAAADRSATFSAGDGPRELHDLAVALEEAFAARHRAEETVRAFVADASHELRGPLTTLNGWLDLYLQGAVEPGPELDRAIASMERETGRMRLLVDELGLLARLDRGLPLAKEEVDLTALAHEVVEDARVVDRDRPLSLAAADAALVRGDASRLAQVLRNLVGNAMQHTPAGTPVEVGVRVEAADAVVTVVDHGPGIAPEHQGRLFDRFYRADPSRAGEGSGLGLSIVSSLVDAHGGTVTVDSRVGEGATVTVRLPLAG